MKTADRADNDSGESFGAEHTFQNIDYSLVFLSPAAKRL